MKAQRLIPIVSIILLIACAELAKPVQVPKQTVNDQMVKIVTPTTNTLWNVEDPKTETEWQILDDAAIAVIDVFSSIKEGGSGPNDIKWASNADWDTFSQEVVTAAEAARTAIANRDLDGLFAANDALYPPCENCHKRYHPGLNGQAGQ